MQREGGIAAVRVEPDPAAIGLEGDGPLLVGAPERGATLRDAGQHLGVGVAVAVPPAQAHEGDGRGQLPEPRGPGGAPGAVMPHFEHRDRPDPPGEPLLDRQPGIADEERPERAVLDQQDDGVLVQVLGGVRPARVGMQDAEAHPVELEGLPVARRRPGDPPGVQQVEQPGVERVGDQRPRLEHLPHRRPVEHRGEPAQVIEMRVGDHRQGEPTGPLPRKKRQHHPPSGIEPLSRRAGINQDPASPRRPEECGVPLADVQKM